MKKTFITIVLFLLVQVSWTSIKAQSVSYLSPVYNSTASDSITSGINRWVTKSCTNYTQVNSSNTTWGTSGSDTWYVVSSNLTINHKITCYGRVHLILKDGCNVNISVYVQGAYNAGCAIFVDKSSSLEIFAQSTDTAVMGRLTAEGYGNGLMSAAGIGGAESTTSKYIIINGGIVTATGSASGAGIGGGGTPSSSDGGSGYGKNITINGGVVTANGGSNAAGIGGGFISCSFSNVNASKITINGGIVYANGGSNGAGIGSGSCGSAEYITINGGTITANGGENAAGIGAQSGCSYINILGGDITSQGGSNKPGIGGSSVKNITISGGNIVAIGGSNAAGIGAGSGSCENVNIYGGNIIANGGEYGSGIGSGSGTSSNIYFSDDMIVKAGMSANPTTVLQHTATTDMSSYLNGKRYATAINMYLQQFVVTANVNDASMGSVTGWGTYNYGDNVTLVAVANAGYEFIRWNTGETSNILSFTVTNDVTYTATFAPIASGIESVCPDNYLVFAANNSIIVQGATNQSVYLYDTAGKLIAFEENASEETSFNVSSPGIYMVKIGDAQTIKIIIQ